MGKPKYFFDIHEDQKLTKDDEGVEFATLDEVRIEVVLVRAEDGNPIYSATLAFAGLWLKRSLRAVAKRPNLLAPAPTGLATTRCLVVGLKFGARHQMTLSVSLKRFVLFLFSVEKRLKSLR